MRSYVSLICLTAVVLWTAKVHAGGLEYVGAGAQAEGRGGAVTAKADDPMVLAYNPAGLAELRGSQLLLDINVATMHACVDPIGYYGWGVYGGGTASRLPNPKTGQPFNLNLGDGLPGPATSYYAQPYDTVCMKQNVTPIPQLAYTARVSERLGLGFGLIFPAATPQGSWGSQEGVIIGATGDPRPAATRYMLINSGTIGIFPNAGFGFRVTDWFRIGATFEWGIIHVDNLNMAALSGGNNPASDILARVRATDWFVPAFNASVHLVPIDSLDIVGAFRYQSDLDAPGKINLTTGTFDPRGIPVSNRETVLGVHQKFPWKIRGGIRYSNRLAPRPTGTGNNEAHGLHGERIHDALEDERWDLEFDLEYQANGRNQQQDIEYAQNQSIAFENTDHVITNAMFPNAERLGGTTDTVVQKRWRNQISARLGGSYNVVPGLFSVSFGAHYENRGVDPSYMQIDYWPVQRIGLHAGIKIRVAHSIDLVASYAHIFQETLLVSAPAADTGDNISKQFTDTGTIDKIDKHAGVPAGRGMEAPVLTEPATSRTPDGGARLAENVTKLSSGSPPTIINAGTYRSSMDVVAIGANLHF